VPTGVAVIELVESVASFAVVSVAGSPGPPAMNSVSSVEPAVFAEKPMPNNISLCWVVQFVAVHAAFEVSTWNSLPSENRTHATAFAIDPHRERRAAEQATGLARAREGPDVFEHLGRGIELRQRVVRVDEVDELRSVGAAVGVAVRARARAADVAVVISARDAGAVGRV